MADFRDISQQYAQGGIKAAILVNGGGAIALLSQAGDLLKQNLADDIACAMVWWAAGVFVGAVCWVIAFLSARYVDKSEREAADRRLHERTSNILMYATMAGFGFSMICFGIGAYTLASALGH